MTNTMKMMEINDEMLEAVNGGVIIQPDEYMPRKIEFYNPLQMPVIFPWDNPKQWQDEPCLPDDGQAEKIREFINSIKGPGIIAYGG